MFLGIDMVFKLLLQCIYYGSIQNVYEYVTTNKWMF